MSAEANHMIKIWQEGSCASDTPSFNNFLRFYYARLVRFAIQFVHIREAAEELVSDSFVKIWDRRWTLHEVRILELYLYVTLKNGCLNYYHHYSRVHLQPTMSGEIEV